MSLNTNLWREDLTRRALIAKDQGSFLAAAELFEQVISLGGGNLGLSLISGHMYKEGRDFAKAERHYLDALRQASDNAEVLLQLGHFYKITGRYIEAEKYYEQVRAILPDWDEARMELDRLRNSTELKLERERIMPGNDIDAQVNGLISEDMLPKTREQLYNAHREEFVITRGGNHQRTRWGIGATVRGVDSLRGFIISATPLLVLEIFLDGELVHKGELRVAPLRRERENSQLRKYVYNAWIDFSKFPYGEYELVYRASNIRGDAREGIEWRRERIIVAEPIGTEHCKSSPASVPPLEPNPTLSVVEQVNALPSLVFKPSPRSYPGQLKNVAVLRADQLGDMVVSVPALRRLREILPTSRIVGLVSPANAALARTLNVFDELILLDFPDNVEQRDRIVERAGQEALIAQLKPYKFDLAIDFSVAGPSHKLLPMTGAPMTLGFRRGGDKSMDLVAEARGPKGGEVIIRHSSWVQLIVEALALWLDSGAKPVRRTDLSKSMITPYGLAEDDEYVFLHSGSRLAFIRWPHYPELACRVLSLGKKVLYMAEDQSHRELLPQDALESGQLVYLAQKLPFEHFDALLSYSAAFVGNDSGPKHLASLRGVKAVSLHPARADWREWGQEFTGVIIGRQVPCAGCQLYFDPEECAQGVPCINNISVDEVFRELRELLDA
ncbi:glycosyltransferase family 9 protein [Pararobbsia alpina]|uniref:Uncharacterized protein n=1 Tax=Pararobbsia alpina TaxID=621374 RepID=A0A6S7AZ14_9BURK|nr:glycosyltransferase family 9 protein [Pararobbsia alpina]CAB3782104.1 hypothetical protein LMG28138_01441 [Pararobbsia alpina]